MGKDQNTPIFEGKCDHNHKSVSNDILGPSFWQKIQEVLFLDRRKDKEGVVFTAPKDVHGTEKDKRTCHKTFHFSFDKIAKSLCSLSSIEAANVRL